MHDITDDDEQGRINHRFTYPNRNAPVANPENPTETANTTMTTAGRR